eukprot:XP_015583694.1 protein GRIM REAPER [Ricinus communis]
MASCLLKNTTILSILLLLFLNTPKTQSTDIEDEDDDEVYVLDHPLQNSMSRSRFLTTVIRKGKHCDPTYNNICSGVSANNGTSLLYCCKKHCRNILGDKNNCGQCSHKCKFGEHCCHGICTNVASSADHCGKCNRKCASGVPCNYGSCGYA